MRWLTLAFSVIFRTLPDLEVPRFNGSSVCTKLSLSESSLYKTVLLPSFLVLIRGGLLNRPPNTLSPNCPPNRFSNSSSVIRARFALVAPREAPRPPRPRLPPRPPPLPLPQPLPPLPPLPTSEFPFDFPFGFFGLHHFAVVVVSVNVILVRSRCRFGVGIGAASAFRTGAGSRFPTF